MAYINGPFNYIQLSGNVNNIQKNITLFMDIHLDINNQTRCTSFDSIDISQYLYNEIKNAKEPLDFFMEIRNEHLQEPQTDKRNIYIFEVIEMFKSEFILEKDKVKYSKSNPNVRLHYLDIRDHLQFNYVIKILKKNITPVLNSLKDNNLNDSDKINKLEQLKKYVQYIQKYIIDIFKNIVDIKQNKLYKFENKSQEYYINKIINKYKHKTIKKNIYNFFNIFLIKYIGELDRIISEIILQTISYKININYQTNLSELFKLYNKLDENIFGLYGLITDVYFLRRLLDKDYIKNVITYCGRNHALNYIYFLVKYCDFKIEKIYNSNGLSIDEFTNQIKETDELNKVHNLFLLEGEKPKQCIIKPSPHYLLGW